MLVVGAVILLPKTYVETCLLRTRWFLGETSGDPEALVSTRGETLGARLGFMSILARLRERILRVVGKLCTTYVLLFMLVSRSPFSIISDFESGRPRL